MAVRTIHVVTLTAYLCLAHSAVYVLFHPESRTGLSLDRPCEQQPDIELQHTELGMNTDQRLWLHFNMTASDIVTTQRTRLTPTTSVSCQYPFPICVQAVGLHDPAGLPAEYNNLLPILEERDDQTTNPDIWPAAWVLGPCVWPGSPYVSFHSTFDLLPADLPGTVMVRSIANHHCVGAAGSHVVFEKCEPSPATRFQFRLHTESPENEPLPLPTPTQVPVPLRSPVLPHTSSVSLVHVASGTGLSPAGSLEGLCSSSRHVGAVQGSTLSRWALLNLSSSTSTAGAPSRVQLYLSSPSTCCQDHPCCVQAVSLHEPDSLPAEYTDIRSELEVRHEHATDPDVWAAAWVLGPCFWAGAPYIAFHSTFDLLAGELPHTFMLRSIANHRCVGVVDGYVVFDECDASPATVFHLQQKQQQKMTTSPVPDELRIRNPILMSTIAISMVVLIAIMVAVTFFVYRLRQRAAVRRRSDAPTEDHVPAYAFEIRPVESNGPPVAAPPPHPGMADRPFSSFRSTTTEASECMQVVSANELSFGHVHNQNALTETKSPLLTTPVRSCDDLTSWRRGKDGNNTTLPGLVKSVSGSVRRIRSQTGLDSPQRPPAGGVNQEMVLDESLAISIPEPSPTTRSPVTGAEEKSVVDWE